MQPDSIISVVLDASPPPPPPLDLGCPLDNEMSPLTYSTYVKGILGLEGGGKVVQDKEYITHLINIDCFAKWSFYCTSTV